jgi:hypothetical protein
LRLFDACMSTVRLPRHAADSELPGGREVDRPAAVGSRLEIVYAEREGQPPLPVMLFDADVRCAWLIDSGTCALADALMPAMRPASVGVALLLALGSLAYAPLAIVAAGYAGYRMLRREFRRRVLHAQVEAHLCRTLLDEPPQTDQRSVRSFQISGNSTTSSILRR